MSPQAFSKHPVLSLEVGPRGHQGVLGAAAEGQAEAALMSFTALSSLKGRRDLGQCL